MQFDIEIMKSEYMIYSVMTALGHSQYVVKQ